MEPRERRPRRRRRRRAIRWLLWAVLIAAVFAVGVAVGEALHDNPKPGITVTTVKTIQP
jgi:ferric-dicitrate binding protein FerR (iron transport regulator)